MNLAASIFDQDRRRRAAAAKALPGTLLAQKIHARFGIRPCAGCGSLADEMDAKGVEWCAENIEYLAEQMHQNASRNPSVWVRLLEKASHATMGLTFHKRLLAEVLSELSPGIAAAPQPLREWPAAAVRHLCFHLFPPSSNPDGWRFHAEMLRLNAELFNGMRLVAVMEGEGCESYRTVVDALGSGFTCISYQNDRARRETVSMLSLLRLLPVDDESHITFFGHSKSVVSQTPATMLWRDMMYAACFTMPAVEDGLFLHPITGPFLKLTNGFHNNRHSMWHYSGTFFWFRNHALSGRIWECVDRIWWGAEAWPSLVFGLPEAHRLFPSRALLEHESLYELSFVSSFQEEITQWQKQHLAT